MKKMEIAITCALLAFCMLLILIGVWFVYKSISGGGWIIAIGLLLISSIDVKIDRQQPQAPCAKVPPAPPRPPA